MTDSTVALPGSWRDWLPLAFLAAGACAGISVLAFAGAQPATVDDVFILLVHAKHLAHEGSIYWNATDGHIDGYTSFLDLIMKAAALRFVEPDGLKLDFEMTRGLQALVPLVGFGFVAWFARAEPRRAIEAALLAGLLLATNAACAEGSSYLLETPLYVTVGLLLVGTYLVARQFTPAVLALLTIEAIALSLARPEGLLPGAGLLAAALLDPTRQPPRSHLVASVAAFATAMAGYYAWHLHYFGYWAPNTYYAKSSSVRLNEVEDGLTYVADYARTVRGAVALSPLLILPALVYRGGLRPEMRVPIGVVTTAAFAVLGAVIVSGGDCYAGGRFLALPTCVAAVALVFAWLSATGRARPLLLAAIGIVAAAQMASVAATIPAARQHIADWPLTDATYRCVAAFSGGLNYVVPGGSVAETDYQLLKYYADSLNVIDLCGLSDRDIAHRPDARHVRWGKTDLRDVLRRRADMFVWGTTPARTRSMSDVTMHTLLTDARTHQYFTRVPELPDADVVEGLEAGYLPASVDLCNHAFNVLIRKDLAPKFTNAGFRVGVSE